ncbi:SCO2521 family protein [Catenulispora subtropica]|uniref:SCO2521 family protein n=1 Tax=Catenulispora subtropica TaxID=450798 RepID=A0ABN2RC85_9ACTN
MSRTTIDDDRAARTAEPGRRPPELAFGEVRTCLIQNQGTLSTSASVALMQLTPGSPVSKVERPVRRVVSPEQVTGIDCRLNVAREGKGRAIGTVLSHAVVTNGRVLQGSAHVALTAAASSDRREWRHYLRRQGVAEIIGSPNPNNVLDGFLGDSTPTNGVDLASISDRVIEDVQQSSELDHHTALRASTAVVRWAATLEAERSPTVHIVKSDVPNVHAVRLEGRPGDLPMLLRFCEEFALHEWLLTTVKDVIVARAEKDIDRDRDPLDSLLFALNQLVPLWMPPTYLSERMKALWDGVESRTHYTALFDKQVARVRDLRDQVKIRPPRRF